MRGKGNRSEMARYICFLGRRLAGRGIDRLVGMGAMTGGERRGKSERMTRPTFVQARIES